MIAAALLVSYAYFYQGEGANQNSRFNLTRAIVERHTLRIDAYHESSIGRDKVFWKGHFYSDKAPGLALTAVPVWQAGRIAVRAARKDPSSPTLVVAERYLATVVAVSLPSAAAAACLFLLALRLGASVGGAGFAAAALGLATPFWCYATLFWGHALSAACLLFAFAAAAALREFESSRHDLLLGTLVGLAAGWATVTEFPAAPPAGILALLALAYARRGGSTRLFRVATGIAAGALACVLVLLIHNTLAFGSPIRFGYAIVAYEFPWMRSGLMGVTYPKAHVLREILLGRYRGLLPVAPLVGAAPLGLRLLWKREDARESTLAVAAIALYYVLFNASLGDWSGSFCYGPRYLSPALPFLCLPVALAYTRGSLALRSLLAVLALYGAALSLVAVSTDVMPSRHVKLPVEELLWPAFRAGQLPARPDRWNLGSLAGLPGLASLFPLFLVWGAAFAAWAWLARRSRVCELPGPDFPW